MFDANRRKFLTRLGALSVLALSPSSFASFTPSLDRRFKICLNPGAIGVSLSQHALLSKAVEYGFEAIVPLPGQLIKMEDGRIDKLLSGMKQHNISWGCAGLPVQFRQTTIQFKKDIQALPAYAKILSRLGVRGMSTWIMPTHPELTYRQNFALHKERLEETAKILEDYGIWLGLEYVGPKTLMVRDKFPFMHTMEECLELIEEINTDNVGFQLDTFHWYCAGESVEDILALDPRKIITVDLNDARKGRLPEEQLDGERELPGVSGMIDIKSFLGALVKIGYQGPVRAEPFNEALNKLENEAALQQTINAMQDVVSKIE